MRQSDPGRLRATLRKLLGWLDDLLRLTDSNRASGYPPPEISGNWRRKVEADMDEARGLLGETSSVGIRYASTRALRDHVGQPGAHALGCWREGNEWWVHVSCAREHL